MTRQALALAVLGLFARPAAAATDGRSPEALCEASALVVVAEVTTTETLWATGPAGGLETRAWAAVDRVVKGRGKAPTLEIRYPGGARDGLRQWVEETPHLQPDRRYLLFLAPGPVESWRPAAGSRSAVPLRRHPREPGVDPRDALTALGDCGAP